MQKDLFNKLGNDLEKIMKLQNELSANINSLVILISKSLGRDKKRKISLTDAVLEVLLESHQPMTAMEIRDHIEEYIILGLIQTENKNLHNAVQSVIQPNVKKGNILKIKFFENEQPTYIINKKQLKNSLFKAKAEGEPE